MPHSIKLRHTPFNSLKGYFYFFIRFQYFILHCFICRLSDSTVLEDAGIKLRTVLTSALTFRRSNYLARSHHPIQLRHTPQHWQFAKFIIVVPREPQPCNFHSKLSAVNPKTFQIRNCYKNWAEFWMEVTEKELLGLDNIGLNFCIYKNCICC